MFTATGVCVDSPSRESGQRDRPILPFDEFVSALAHTSSPEWDLARCRRMTRGATRLFFSEDIADIKQAKSICADCPLASRCLQGALDRREPCGVWGGYLFANGLILAHKRPRARPPKHGPAEDIRQLSPHVRLVGGASPTLAPE
jgi:WhiB family transcriptional regulator, redox-sensing transcriptional regulator